MLQYTIMLFLLLHIYTRLLVSVALAYSRRQAAVQAVRCGGIRDMLAAATAVHTRRLRVELATRR